jgi:hypothetical protein
MRPREQSWLRVWAYPMLLAGVALGFDAADRAVPFGLLSTGLLDEIAHLATAALGLMVLVRFIDAPRRFYAAALVASVAIDLDHIPLYLGLLPDRDQCSPVPRLPAADTGPCWPEQRPGWCCISRAISQRARQV